MPAFVLQQKADAAAVDAREAIADKQAVAAGKDAAVTVVQVQLDASREAESRSAARYRAEVLNHAQDMQELSASKEAEAEAESAREKAETQAAERAAELEACKLTYEERERDGSAQLAQLEERLKNASTENALLHKQLVNLTDSGAAGGGGGSGSAEGDATMEIISVVRKK